LFTVVPCLSGRLWRTPNTYRKAGIRRGTATSSSTRSGTSSTWQDDALYQLLTPDPDLVVPI